MLLQAAFDLADAAGAADALDREIHDATVPSSRAARTSKDRAISAMVLPQCRTTRLRGAEHARSPSRDSSMTRSHCPADRRGCVRGSVPARLRRSATMLVGAPVGRMHEPRDRLQGRRAAGRRRRARSTSTSVAPAAPEHASPSPASAARPAPRRGASRARRRGRPDRSSRFRRRRRSRPRRGS